MFRFLQPGEQKIKAGGLVFQSAILFQPVFLTEGVFILPLVYEIPLPKILCSISVFAFSF